MSCLPRSLSFTAWLFSLTFSNMVFWTFYQKHSQVNAILYFICCFVKLFYFVSKSNYFSVLVFLFFVTWHVFFFNSEKGSFFNFEKVSLRKKKVKFELVCISTSWVIQQIAKGVKIIHFLLKKFWVLCSVVKLTNTLLFFIWTMKL